MKNGSYNTNTIIMRKIYFLLTAMLLGVATSGMAQEEQTAKELDWSVPANYYSAALDNNFECSVEAYTDGTYAIKGVYGSDQDIEFTIDSESVIDGVPEIIMTNYYNNSYDVYYYFGAGEYVICAYYSKGGGYTGWEGDSETPGIWYYTYLYDLNNNYLGGGYDNITWNKEDKTGISHVAVSSPRKTGRVTSISGVSFPNKENLPSGIYISDGKKFVVR